MLTIEQYKEIEDVLKRYYGENNTTCGGYIDGKWISIDNVLKVIKCNLVD